MGGGNYTITLSTHGAYDKKDLKEAIKELLELSGVKIKTTQVAQSVTW